MRMWTRYYKAYDDDKIKIGEISEELRNALDIFFFFCKNKKELMVS